MTTDKSPSATLQPAADSDRLVDRLRPIGWSLVAVLLLLPAVAMQYAPGSGVDWTVGDFLFAAILLNGTGLLIEFIVWQVKDARYRLGAGLALLTALCLVWVNGAVGLIGTENDKANLLYLVLLQVGLAAAFIVRFRAAGMARALFLLAGLQLLITLAALWGHWGVGESSPLEVLLGNALFIVLWSGSGLLFRSVKS